jgi:flagellar protein FlaJ
LFVLLANKLADFEKIEKNISIFMFFFHGVEMGRNLLKNRNDFKKTMNGDTDFSISRKTKYHEKNAFWIHFLKNPFQCFLQKPVLSFSLGLLLSAFPILIFYAFRSTLSFQSFLLTFLSPSHIAFIFSPVSLILFSFFFLCLPFMYFEEMKQKRTQAAEENMPPLLRDISNLIAGGLTIQEALAEVSDIEKIKTKDKISKSFFQNIHLIGLKMRSGIPFEIGLEQLGKQYQSKLIQRAASVIEAAEKSGGRMSLSIDAAAYDLTEIVNMKKERDSKQAVYGIVLFASFVLFIGIAVLLIYQFQYMHSILSNSASFEILGLTNQMIFHLLLIQAFFSGIMIGKLRKGNSTFGLKYSFLLLFLTWAPFLILFGVT